MTNSTEPAAAAPKVADGAGPIQQPPPNTPPEGESQGLIFAQEAVERLKGPRDSLTTDDALDLLIRLESEAPILQPHVAEDEYLLAGDLREVFSWMIRHCKELGYGAKTACMWHWHGKKGSWLSKGRVVQAQIQVFRPAAQYVSNFTAALVVNARWWQTASPTARIRAIWRFRL